MRGEDKLLEPIAGVPILRHVATEAVKARIGPVAAFIRPEDQLRRKVLRNLDLQIIEVPDARLGMSVTLKACARHALQKTDAANASADDCTYFGMMVLLPDMPEISAQDLQRLAAAFPAFGGPVVRAATEDGAPGHPLIIPDTVLRGFDLLTGDQGAAQLLKDEPTRLVALEGNRARLDLDTPEAWAAWRATQTD